MPSQKAAAAAALLKEKQTGGGILGASDGVTEPQSPEEPAETPAEPEVEIEVVEPEDDEETVEPAEPSGLIVHPAPAPEPVIDRIGLGAPVPSGIEVPVPVDVLAQEPEPEPEPPAQRANMVELVDIDAQAVADAVDPLDDSVFGEVPDEVCRAYLREAVHASRQAVAVGRGRGMLPTAPLSLVIVVDNRGLGKAQLFQGDMTRR